MRYLTRFTFPDAEEEASFFLGVKRTCYDSYYPFGMLSKRELSALDFDPVTILYGGNGSGKTTALNVIAEKLALHRDARYNRSSFFEDYLRRCDFCAPGPIPRESRVITSDDVFDFMLDLRAVNEGVDRRREELFQEYLRDKDPRNPFRYRTMDDYEQLKRTNLARSKTQSQYIRTRLNDNLREQSNGESAWFCFTSRIRENALYLLDEPENSLSPQRQTELAQFLEDSARFYGCQFIIATHSPFLLAMRGARIYDLDADPAVPRRKWTELPAVRAYRDFFRLHESEFD
ncbi:MAG: AAA family ATPase [Clostridiales bacterium]|nr:AAA family ATPase [Clostridiales bacterium]